MGIKSVGFIRVVLTAFRIPCSTTLWREKTLADLADLADFQ